MRRAPSPARPRPARGASRRRTAAPCSPTSWRPCPAPPQPRPGAGEAREGRCGEADGGTLFLDELATLSSPAQDRLLRAVEYGEITRIGASRPVKGDGRIGAGTHAPRPRRAG